MLHISHFISPLLLTTIYPCTPAPPHIHFSSITVLASEALPMLIIVGGAVGGGCVLLICVITLVSLCCRHTGKGELNGQYGLDGQPIPPIKLIQVVYNNSLKIEQFLFNFCAVSF